MAMLSSVIVASLHPTRSFRGGVVAKYNARGKIDRTTYQATIDIAIHTADLPADDEP
jgi:hypothetical protein